MAAAAAAATAAVMERTAAGAAAALGAAAGRGREGRAVAVTSAASAAPGLDDYFVFAGKVYSRGAATRTTTTTTTSGEAAGAGERMGDGEETGGGGAWWALAAVAAVTLSVTCSAMAAWSVLRGVAERRRKARRLARLSWGGDEIALAGEDDAGGEEATVEPDEERSPLRHRARTASGDNLVVRRVSRARPFAGSVSSGAAAAAGRPPASAAPLLPPPPPPATPQTTQAKIKDLAALMGGGKKTTTVAEAEPQDAVSRAVRVLGGTSLAPLAQRVVDEPANADARELLRRETREWVSVREWIAPHPHGSESEARRVAESALVLLQPPAQPLTDPVLSRPLTLQDALLMLSTPPPLPRRAAAAEQEEACRVCRTRGPQPLSRLSEFRRLVLADRVSLSAAGGVSPEDAARERALLLAVASPSPEPDAYLVAPPRWHASCPVVTWTLSFEFAVTVKVRRACDPEALFRALETARLDGWRRAAVGVIVPRKGVYGRGERLASYDALVVVGHAHAVAGNGFHTRLPPPPSPTSSEDRKLVSVFFAPGFAARFREALLCVVRGVPPPLTALGGGRSSAPLSSPPLVELLRDPDRVFPHAYVVSCSRAGLDRARERRPHVVLVESDDGLVGIPAPFPPGVDAAHAVVWALRPYGVAFVFCREGGGGAAAPHCACEWARLVA